jgi:hypothetical protein
MQTPNPYPRPTEAPQDQGMEIYILNKQNPPPCDTHAWPRKS